ncbi:MAG: o-succinylbenzoate synthase [Thermoguttaceae bacterium]
MQIDSIEIFHVALPYRKPQTTTWGVSESLQTVLVRLQSGDVVGWGEACPGNSPASGPEWTGSVFLCLRDWLAPLVVRRVVDTGSALSDALAAVRGNRFAKAALDTAWWDLNARLAGQPLHQMLGGQRNSLEVGTGFDRMETIDLLIEAMGRAFEAGYARVELKFRPGWDVQMVNAVRSVFPSQRLHIDVEGGLRLDHMEMLCRLDDFMLAMIEQPLAADDLVGHAMIQDTIRTPICLDESIATIEQAEMALELHSAKYVSVKPGRVGGLTTAVAIHDACHDQCIACWVAGTAQSAIGARIGLALAAKANFGYPTDFGRSEELLQVDLAPLPEMHRDPADGLLHVALWSAPGIGVEPDMELLEKHLIARAKL